MNHELASVEKLDALADCVLRPIIGTISNNKLQFPSMQVLRILLVEDDVHTAAMVRDGLGGYGYVVEVAADGRIGRTRALEREWDVLIIDRMLPKLDGLDLIRTLREKNIKTPVLILTALSGIRERNAGLQAGADGYLVKPFALSELAARATVLARRDIALSADVVLRVKDLELNRQTHHVIRGERTVDLRPVEYAILEYLMRHAGHLITKTMLHEHVWGFHFDPREAVIESHLSRLHSKIEGEFAPRLLHTIPGTGYRLGDEK